MDDFYTFIVVWTVAAALVGIYSEKKGFGFPRGFFLSILLSPVGGLLIVGFMKGKR